MQVIKNIQDLNPKSPSQISTELEALKNSGEQRSSREITVIPHNGSVSVTIAPNDTLDEYDIISSEKSDSSSLTTPKVNGHGKHNNPRYSTIDVDVLNDQPRYVISKGYTAKRKDEIFLPLGTVVGVLDTKDNRSYVVAFTKNGRELDRGWVPSFCLQLKEEAVEITSKEG